MSFYFYQVLIVWLLLSLHYCKCDIKSFVIERRANHRNRNIHDLASLHNPKLPNHPSIHTLNSVINLCHIKGGNIQLGNLVNLQLPLLKIGLQLAVTLLNCLCWYIPLKTQNFHQESSLLGYGNAFAGGIFLMLSLGHMIPHAIESLESQGVKSISAFYLSLVGYSLILFIEKIAFNTHELLHNDTNESNAVESVNQTNNKVSGGSMSDKSAIVLVLALSLHSLFEALALGLAADTTATTLLSASIALHQPAESLSLLIAFLRTSLPTSDVIKWLSFYSFVGPLGVILGKLLLYI